MDQTRVSLRQLLFDSEKIWKSRFDRAASIVREYGYAELADMILGIKSSTFDSKTPVLYKVDSPRERNYIQILDYIRLNGHATAKELKDLLNISKDSLGERLRSLQSQGKIIKTGTGTGPGTYYTLPKELKAVG